MKHRGLRFLIGIPIVLLVLLYLALVSRLFWELLFVLPTGWYSFLQRTLPEVRMNWSGIALVLICAGFALALIHSSGRALTRGIGNSKSQWPFRRTFAVFVAFCWLFVVVIASSGLFRTAQEVATTREPLFVVRERGERMALYDAGSQVAILMADDAKAAAMRSNVVALPSTWPSRSGGTLWERYEFVVVETSDGFVEEVIVCPRNR
jgi:hypothetical protein